MEICNNTLLKASVWVFPYCCLQRNSSMWLFIWFAWTPNIRLNFNLSFRQRFSTFLVCTPFSGLTKCSEWFTVLWVYLRPGMDSIFKYPRHSSDKNGPIWDHKKPSRWSLGANFLIFEEASSLYRNFGPRNCAKCIAKLSRPYCRSLLRSYFGGSNKRARG